MTDIEFSIVMKRAKRWTVVVYTLVSLTLMLSIVGCWYVWFPELTEWTSVFRDQSKPVEDDGMFGAMIALLVFVLFLVPSALLPLIPVVFVDRSLGIECPECHASLTLWKRGEAVLQSGACTKCSAKMFESVECE